MLHWNLTEQFHKETGVIFDQVSKPKARKKKTRRIS